jgi:protoporphyrinogen IX oxidase
MAIVVNLLLWAHFMGLAMGLGGGVALSQIGPRLVAAPVDQRTVWWPLETFFSRIGAAGLTLLLITGPLMLWLKFGGPGGMTGWFWAKMALVAVAVFGIGLHEWAGARLKRGDEGAIGAMFFGGRLAGAAMALVVVCAVFAFN